MSGRGLAFTRACTRMPAPVDAVEVAEDFTVLLDRLELRRANIGRAAALAQAGATAAMALTGYRRACRPTLTHLQAGLEDFDEAADLVGDLGARRAELVRADDLVRKSGLGRR